MALGAEPAPGEVRVEKDMGLGESEFLAAMPRVLTAFCWEQVEPGLIRAARGERELLIAYGPEALRVIAAVRLPHLPVTLIFRRFAAADRDSFLGHFDRRFRRGGG